jgi:hypothetical protein
MSLALIALGALWAPGRFAQACQYPPPPGGYSWTTGDEPYTTIMRGGYSVNGQTFYLPYNANNTSWGAYGFSFWDYDYDDFYYYGDFVTSVYDGSWQTPVFYPSFQNQPQHTTLYGRWEDDDYAPEPINNYYYSDANSNDGQREQYVGLYLVAVDKVQTQNDGTWEDVPESGPVYVLKGTTANFKAIKNPSGASWPSGKPVWGGSSGASGTGETKSVTFDTVSSSSTNYKTVTCECGNTKTVNVIVFELTATLTPVDNWDGRLLTSYGLEEIVNLTHTTNPTGISPSLQWKISGVGSLPTQTYYDAGPSAGSVSFKLEVTAGPSKGQGPTGDCSVIVPNGSYMVKKPGTGIRHSQYTCSCGFLGLGYITPTTVSFTNLETRETTCTATATGYYSYKNGEQHPLGSWLPVDDGKDTPESGCCLWEDEIWSGDDGPTSYSIGVYVWSIPVQYRASDGAVHTLTADQNHRLDADAQGKCTISKNGAGPFSKNASEGNSSW